METIKATTRSESGYASVSRVGEYELQIDGADEEGPTPTKVLVVDYASCFVPAFRVSGHKEGYDDLGRIEIDVSADVDAEGNLEAIRFSLRVEADLSDSALSAILARAEDSCHVQNALREGLHAEIDATVNAF